ncbi:hypothetical protein ALQ59_01683 [Pseudomonas syringae pv. apii]|nr:hypothetical protein ALQ59_01683 [Pseudomonas syringae pv. apii]
MTAPATVSVASRFRAARTRTSGSWRVFWNRPAQKSAMKATTLCRGPCLLDVRCVCRDCVDPQAPENGAEPKSLHARLYTHLEEPWKGVGELQYQAGYAPVG